MNSTNATKSSPETKNWTQNPLIEVAKTTEILLGIQGNP